MKCNKYLLACACVFAVAAHAESNWYVLGDIGQSNFGASNSDVNDILPGYEHVTKVAVDNTGAAYRLQAGYQFTENFGVEGGYFDLGNIQYEYVPALNAGVATLVPIHENIKIKFSAFGWNLSAVGVLPLKNNLSLFARAGVARATVKTKIEVTDSFLGDRSAAEKSAHVKPLFGIGVSYKLNNNLLLQVEAQRYSNLPLHVKAERYSDFGDSGAIRESNVDFYSVGIAYKF